MDTTRAGSAGVKDVPDPRSRESGTNYWARDKAGRKQLRDAWNDERFDWTAASHTIVIAAKGMARQSVIDVHRRRGWRLKYVMKVGMGNHEMTFVPGEAAVVPIHPSPLETSAPLPAAPPVDTPAWDPTPPRPDAA
jgi:hypothetical protein